MKLNEKTFDSIMRGTAKPEKLKQAIELADNEIKEWQSFKIQCENLLKTNLKQYKEKPAIENFIAQFNSKEFSSNKDIELWLRENIASLVEEIYKEELEISDKRWKVCEERLRDLK